MIDGNFSLMRAHRNDISRYRQLSKIDRRLPERRYVGEQSALEGIAASSFPFTFTLPASSATIGEFSQCWR